MTVSWFRPQNQAGYGLSVAPQNQQEYEDDAGYASRSSGLLHLKVRLGFFSLVSRLVEAWRGSCTCHYYGGYVELKLKTGGSMRWAASEPSTPTLLFSMYYVI
jgi:hypothetical protein